MNKHTLSCLIAVFLLAWPCTSMWAGDEVASVTTCEYITIRWGGRENTHIVHGNGRVEFLKAIFSQHQRPDRTDERAYYMNIAMNAAAKQGYKFVGMTYDEIVMERPVPK